MKGITLHLGLIFNCRLLSHVVSYVQHVIVLNCRDHTVYKQDFKNFLKKSFTTTSEYLHWPME